MQRLYKIKNVIFSLCLFPFFWFEMPEKGIPLLKMAFQMSAKCQHAGIIRHLTNWTIAQNNRIQKKTASNYKCQAGLNAASICRFQFSDFRLQLRETNFCNHPKWFGNFKKCFFIVSVFIIYISIHKKVLYNQNLITW